MDQTLAGGKLVEDRLRGAGGEAQRQLVITHEMDRAIAGPAPNELARDLMKMAIQGLGQAPLHRLPEAGRLAAHAFLPLRIDRDRELDPGFRRGGARRQRDRRMQRCGGQERFGEKPIDRVAHEGLGRLSEQRRRAIDALALRGRDADPKTRTRGRGRGR